jgi:CheY-like chemotaxis protein
MSTPNNDETMKLPLNNTESEGPNLTPVIDVVFLLLIFFLVATRFDQEERELDVELPEVSGLLAGTILVVDDEEEVRDVLSDMLETLGVGVVTASHGAEAVETFRESPDAFRAVILDMAMPTMGGAEALPALREIREDIPIIICTGYGQDQGFEETEPSAILQKPFKLTTLVETLRWVLEGS